MRKSGMIMLAAAGVLSAPLQAQSTGVALRGIRVEANAGGDRYSSSNTRRTKFGYGATIGADLELSRFILGVEGSYWRDAKRVTNCLTGGAGTFCNSSGQHELGAAVRAGYALTPQLLIFGKAGIVRDRQRNIFTSSGSTFYVNGQFVPAPPSSDTRFSESGYELGGGLEYSLASHFYADAQYVYSHYRNETVRNRVMLGLGYRFP
ncbi:MAG: outer membrane beta-barrel protein [Sphingomicrobium sp.]